MSTASPSLAKCGEACWEATLPPPALSYITLPVMRFARAACMLNFRSEMVYADCWLYQRRKSHRKSQRDVTGNTTSSNSPEPTLTRWSEPSWPTKAVSTCKQQWGRTCYSFCEATPMFTATEDIQPQPEHCSSEHARSATFQLHATQLGPQAVDERLHAHGAVMLAKKFQIKAA